MTRMDFVKRKCFLFLGLFLPGLDTDFEVDVLPEDRLSLEFPRFVVWDGSSIDNYNIIVVLLL